jgi:uncharacterized YigZ family protein
MSETAFTYKTILAPTEALLKDRGSKFLAFSFPANTTEEVKTRVQQLKKEHPKANHHCLAFRIGTEGLLFRASDDGEPSGSAGKPILGQIDSAGLTNVLVVVVRYFGGTLLGVPGLIHAYKTVAADCLARSEVIEKNIEFPLTVSFDYSLMNEVMQVCKQFDITIYQQETLLFCQFALGVPLQYKAAALNRLGDIRGLSISENV